MWPSSHCSWTKVKLLQFIYLLHLRLIKWWWRSMAGNLEKCSTWLTPAYIIKQVHFFWSVFVHPLRKAHEQWRQVYSPQRHRSVRLSSINTRAINKDMAKNTLIAPVLKWSFCNAKIRSSTNCTSLSAGRPDDDDAAPKPSPVSTERGRIAQQGVHTSFKSCGDSHCVNHVQIYFI